MTDPRIPVTEDELHAYVDGELPADRRGAVEAWLATHADDAARVAAWRAQAEVIRKRYGGVANEVPPKRLQVERLTRSRRSWMAAAIAAVLVAFIAGGAAGWFARGAEAASPSDLDRFTADALEAYRLYVVEVRHPVEVPGDQRPHLVEWLSKRLGSPLRAPELERMGLKLVGGRLLPGPNGATAFFMYEGPSGERFTLYCGRTFRLKGKGFPAKAGRGDLLATIRIVLPEKRDAELDELMKKWQGDKPYDPRKDM